jgi:hypothetical protein
MKGPINNGKQPLRNNLIEKMQKQARGIQKLATQHIMQGTSPKSRKQHKLKRTRNKKNISNGSKILDKTVPDELESVIGGLINSRKFSDDELVAREPLKFRKRFRSWMYGLYTTNALPSSSVNVFLTNLHAIAFLSILIQNLELLFRQAITEKAESESFLRSVELYQENRDRASAINYKAYLNIKENIPERGRRVTKYVWNVLKSITNEIANASWIKTRELKEWKHGNQYAIAATSGHVELLKSILVITEPVYVLVFYERLMELVVESAIQRIGMAVAKTYLDGDQNQIPIDKKFVPTPRLSTQKVSGKKSRSERSENPELKKKIIDNFVTNPQSTSFLFFLMAMIDNPSKRTLKGNIIIHEDLGNVDIDWLVGLSKDVTTKQYTERRVTKRIKSGIDERRVSILPVLAKGVESPKPGRRPSENIWLLNEFLFSKKKSAYSIINMAYNLLSLLRNEGTPVSNWPLEDSDKIVLARVVRTYTKSKSAAWILYESELARMSQMITDDAHEQDSPSNEKERAEYQQMWDSYPTNEFSKKIPLGKFYAFRKATHAKKKTALSQFFCSVYGAQFWSTDFKVFVDEAEKEHPASYRSKYIQWFLNPSKKRGAALSRANPSPLELSGDEESKIPAEKKVAPDQPFDSDDLVLLSNQISSFMEHKGLRRKHLQENHKAWLLYPEMLGYLTHVMSLLEDGFLSAKNKETINELQRKYTRSRNAAINKKVRSKFREYLKKGISPFPVFSAEHLREKIREEFQGPISAIAFLEEFGAMFPEAYVNQLLKNLYDEEKRFQEPYVAYQNSLRLKETIENLRVKRRQIPMNN